MHHKFLYLLVLKIRFQNLTGGAHLQALLTDLLVASHMFPLPLPLSLFIFSCMIISTFIFTGKVSSIGFRSECTSRRKYSLYGGQQKR